MASNFNTTASNSPTFNHIFINIKTKNKNEKTASHHNRRWILVERRCFRFSHESICPFFLPWPKAYWLVGSKVAATRWHAHHFSGATMVPTSTNVYRSTYKKRMRLILTNLNQWKCKLNLKPSSLLAFTITSYAGLINILCYLQGVWVTT